MLKQILIFLVGLVSMLVAVAGVVCAIQAIATKVVFCIICAILFLPVWAWLAIEYFKDKCPEGLGETIYNKLKKK